MFLLTYGVLVLFVLWTLIQFSSPWPTPSFENFASGRDLRPSGYSNPFIPQPKRPPHRRDLVKKLFDMGSYRHVMANAPLTELRRTHATHPLSLTTSKTRQIYVLTQLESCQGNVCLPQESSRWKRQYQSSQRYNCYISFRVPHPLQSRINHLATQPQHTNIGATPREKLPGTGDHHS